MKILLVHNYYQSSAPSGEDIVFNNERKLLEGGGHEVITYERHSDHIGASAGQRISVSLQATWSSKTYRDLIDLIDQHRPDVAHFHNTFPMVSPSAYRACQASSVPVVQTLHNYRLICPGALLLRNGRPCEDCIGGSLLPAVVHGCYRGSRAASAVVSCMLQIHRWRGTYHTEVDRYIALSEFARDLFIRGGIPPEKIVVRANSLPYTPACGPHSGGYALYVGRLTPEKGIGTLIEAWRAIRYPLRVVGDGAMRKSLEEAVKQAGSAITFLGHKTADEVAALMQDATLLVIPSESYESAFPLTAHEGLATATPLLVSAIGAMNIELTENVNCLKFMPGNAASLRERAMALIGNQALQKVMCDSNRALYLKRFPADQALPSLLDIYASTLQPSDHMTVA